MSSSAEVRSHYTFARRRTARRRFCWPVTTPLHWMFQVQPKTRVSARKLAAGLWRLCFSSDGSQFWSFDGSCWELGSCCPSRKYAIEESTKWDCRCSKTSEIHHSRSHRKRLKNQVQPVSAIFSLKEELLQAQSQIHELESEELFSKQKLKKILRKIGRERSSQCIGEFDKSLVDIRQLKHELRRENKKQQNLGVHYAKLINELAEAKLSVEKFKRDYKEEKKTRKIFEGVCYELAKKLGNEKVQFEGFKQELLQMRQELEEERSMLQMAEVWREEHVQMKLIDAKIALENKYAEMKKLISVLDSFLRSRNSSLDVSALRDAEQIIEAMKSVNIQDTKALAYVASKSEDVCSIIEDIRQFQAETEPDYALSRDGNAGKDYHPPSTATDDFVIDDFNHSRSLICYSNGYFENQDSRETNSNATISSHRQSVKGGIRLVGPLVHSETSDIANPHIARGMKGLIEWPRSFLKNNLKLEKQILNPKVELNNTI